MDFFNEKGFRGEVHFLNEIGFRSGMYVWNASIG